MEPDNADQVEVSPETHNLLEAMLDSNLSRVEQQNMRHTLEKEGAKTEGSPIFFQTIAAALPAK